MILSRDQAAASLKDIERTSRRSAEAFGYAHASPHFILWGIIWMLGYTASDFALRWAPQIWAVLTLAGVIGSTLIGRRQAAASPSDSASHFAVYRFLAAFAAVGVFIFALFAVLGRPANGMATAAVSPLVVALLYAVIGIWRGVKFLVAGIAVMALTLAGFFLLREHFLLWMAAVGGGSLVLTGLWLRTV